MCVCMPRECFYPQKPEENWNIHPSAGVMSIVRCRMWGLKTEPGSFGRAQMFFTTGASLSSHPKCFLKWIYADFSPDIKELLKFFRESGNQRTWKFYSKNGFLKVRFLLCLIMCRCVCLHVSLCTWGRYFGGCQSLWRWNLQTAVSYMKWVQGPELRLPRRAEGSLKGSAIFPTPSVVLKQMFLLILASVPKISTSVYLI